jgi:hypothetical protein
MARSDLPAERVQFLDELARDVWYEFSVETPTSVDSIASKLRLGPSYADFGTDFDGILEHRSGRFHIYCNIADGKYSEHPRVRFTLAHELGHYFIDEHRNDLRAGQPPKPSFPDRPGDDPIEHEANAFAASLLMPRQKFQDALQAVPGGLKGILELGSTFRVSKQSAALRYANASGRECAIVMFRNGSRPWWEISPLLERSGLNRIKAQKDTIPSDSATGMALADQPSQASDPHITNTLASFWFGGISNGSTRDVFFRESAVRLGAFGVLTLLEPLPSN